MYLPTSLSFSSSKSIKIHHIASILIHCQTRWANYHSTGAILWLAWHHTTFDTACQHWAKTAADAENTDGVPLSVTITHEKAGQRIRHELAARWTGQVGSHRPVGTSAGRPAEKRPIKRSILTLSERSTSLQLNTHVSFIDFFCIKFAVILALVVS